MRTEKEITEAIGKLTFEIREKYPEISKYLNEMPVTNPNEEHPEMNVKVLKDYYDNLVIMMKRYSAEHEPSTAEEKENLLD